MTHQELVKNAEHYVREALKDQNVTEENIQNTVNKVVETMEFLVDE